MILLSHRFEIRTALFSFSPLAALRALDVPGIAVCDVSDDEKALARRVAAIQPHILVLADSPEDPGALYAELLRLAPACPPRVIACRADCAPPDACCELSGLADCLRREMLSPCPALARPSLPRRRTLARQLLTELGMTESLLGFACLAEGAAMLSAVPPPAPPLQQALYPLLAQAFSISPAAVEKRIRGAVESAWLRGDLTAQARLLGLSVSAERGKPTNSELLCRMAEKIREAL